MLLSYSTDSLFLGPRSVQIMFSFEWPPFADLMPLKVQCECRHTLYSLSSLRETGVLNPPSLVQQSHDFQKGLSELPRTVAFNLADSEGEQLQINSSGKMTWSSVEQVLWGYEIAQAVTVLFYYNFFFFISFFLFFLSFPKKAKCFQKEMLFGVCSLWQNVSMGHVTK